MKMRIRTLEGMQTMSTNLVRSLKAGPVRFELKDSGVSTTIDATGFGVRSGPSVNLAHIAKDGNLYKRTQPNKESPSRDGSNLLGFENTSADELLSEINVKHKKPRLAPLVIIAAIIALVVAYALKVQDWVYIVVVLVAAIVYFIAHRRDQLVKTVVLFYELDDPANTAYQRLLDSYKEIKESSRAWRITTSKRVTDTYEWKTQAGASSLVNRHGATCAINTPAYFSTNLLVPAIAAGKQSLYFFPDRLLMYESNRVVPVPYSKLHLEFGNSRFIEGQGVPRDAQVVGHTWQYVNKSGGPDKRYKNNRQLPIVLYSELGFTNATGLDVTIQLSKSNVGSNLREALGALASIGRG